MRALRDADRGRLLTAGLGLLLVAMVSVAAGYVTRGQARDRLELGEGRPEVEYVRGVVQAVTSDSLTLLTESGPVTVRLGTSTPREAVQSASLADIKPGDWVNAGGVAHAQTIYALTALVVIPAGDLEGR